MEEQKKSEKLIDTIAASHAQRTQVIADCRCEREQKATELFAQLHSQRNMLKAEVMTLRKETQQMLLRFRDERKGKKIEIEKQEQQVVTSSFDTAAQNLFTVVCDHTEGMTVQEAATILGLVPQFLGKVAKHLVEEKKIRKEGKKYYPVDREGTSINNEESNA
jgi:hypothetical protein